MNDHELTVMVDRAASGLIDSHAAIHGSPAWAELDAGKKNDVREAALPFIYHGVKALAELGYVKPVPLSADLEAKAILQAHMAICEDSYNECIDNYGHCVKAVEGIAAALTITTKVS